MGDDGADRDQSRSENSREPLATTAARGGRGAAVAVMLGLALIAVAAVGFGGYLIWTAVDSATDGDGFAGPGSGDADPGDDFASLGDAPDFSSFTAVPGTVVSVSAGSKQAGVDFEPGMYVALDPEDGENPCSWNVASAPDILSSAYLGGGQSVTEAPLAAVPDGYYFWSYNCGDWEAVDPDAALAGGTATTLYPGTTIVGHDVVAGAYLARPPAVENPWCAAEVSSDWGFTGPTLEVAYFTSDMASLIVETQPGDVVHLSGDCEFMEHVDLDALFAADTGAETAGPGEYVIGVDLRAGTYALTEPFAPDKDYCAVDIWTDYALGARDDNVRDLHYEDGQTLQFSVAPGQSIKVWGCGALTRMGS